MNAIERKDAVQGTRCLSAHELATLLVLLQAPVDATAATPDVAALQEAGLAQVVDAGPGKANVAITDEGNAMLRVLGVR